MASREMFAFFIKENTMFGLSPLESGYSLTRNV
jgi:hypothetical protein